MPSNGGIAPGSLRTGGKKPTLAFVLQSLNRARGTAYDVSVGSPAWIENMAYARAIVNAWETNERLSYQASPSRLTSTLTRWERILGITPDPAATLPSRRAAVLTIWQRIGVVPTTQSITDELATVGAAFVAIEHQTLGNAVTYWPAGTPNTDAPWYSTLAHVVVKLQRTSTMTEGDFYAAAAKVSSVLSARLPAWCTFDWYRVDANTGLKGFYLDSAHNLDNSVFDV